MKAYIRSIGAYVPQKCVSNDDLAKIVDTSDEWIFSHTGIRNRHIAEESQAASDLGIVAAQNALKSQDVSPDDIDLILVATASPDYNSFPSTACIIQDKLGCKNAGALDITAACSGFVYGLDMAASYIETGRAKNILIIGTEVFSKILNWNDRNTCVLFGDGAGAALLSAAEDSLKSRVVDSILGSIGKDAGALIRKRGGSRLPYGETDEEKNENYVYMNGKKVYLFAVDVLGKIIEMLLSRHNLTINDVSYIVPHQANTRIIEASAKRLGIPYEKFFMNIAEYANTSAATIPIALNEMVEKSLLKRGDLILTIGFGGGLTWGGNILYW